MLRPKPPTEELEKCPVCLSTAPHLHPTRPFTGVTDWCIDVFHLKPTPENTDDRVQAVMERRWYRAHPGFLYTPATGVVRTDEPFPGLIYNPDKGSLHGNIVIDPHVPRPKWLRDIPVAPIETPEKRYPQHTPERYAKYGVNTVKTTKAGWGTIYTDDMSPENVAKILGRWREANPEVTAFWRDPSPLQAAMASPEPWPLDPVVKQRESAPKGEAEETRCWPRGKPIVPETTPEKPGLGKYWEPKDAGIYRMPEQQFEPPPRASKGPSLEHIFRDPPGFDESLAWKPPRPKPGLWGGAPTVLVTREHLDALKKAVADNAQRMIQVCAERDAARTRLMETRAELTRVARERKEARRAEHLAKAELKVVLAALPPTAEATARPSIEFTPGDTIIWRSGEGNRVYRVAGAGFTGRTPPGFIVLIDATENWTVFPFGVVESAIRSGVAVHKTRKS